MRRPRTVEITAEAMTASLIINGFDISDMTHAVDIHIDAESLPTVTIHSIPDVLSFTGIAMVDDPRLDGIERLRRRQQADFWGLTPKEFYGFMALRRRLAEAVG